MSSTLTASHADTGGARLQKAALLAALDDPGMGALNFLNEVIDRYPDAISFAPGAPHASFFDELNVGHYLERYRRHLVEDRGLTEQRATRLLYQYGPARGIINGLLARSLQLDEGLTVDPRAIVVTVGCQEAMVLALRVLCPTPEDLLAVVEPAQMDAAIEARLAALASPAVIPNRRMLVLCEEPLDTFRTYMAQFALEQGQRLYSQDVLQKVAAA